MLKRDDGVAVVTLANGKVNALSGALLRELRDVAGELTADPPGAVVVTGGERIFAAGADISEFGGPDEAGPITALFHEALDAVAAIPRFVIAAVGGYALGTMTGGQAVAAGPSSSSGSGARERSAASSEACAVSGPVAREASSARCTASASSSETRNPVETASAR